ncbi:MAG TPA: response regulator [Gammaproteobacteria bacterium]|nr:response regulator [Gammaproteobacteria bacterium]
MKALVVDDAKLFQHMLGVMLEEEGVECRFAASGAECFDVLEQGPVDMVFLDLHLPDMKGYDVSRRLRETPATQLLPIVLLTADEDDEVLRRGFDAGISEVLRKGDFDELCQTLKRFVRRMRHVCKGRVLYVEDNRAMAALTTRMLVNVGLEVEHFTNAETAFAALQCNDYDIVVTDIVVEGGMSGLGLVSAIRTLDGDKCDLPILAVSGLDDVARRIELLRQGANDYVAKPLLEEEFIARVGNLITNKQLLDEVKAQRKQLAEMAVTDQLTRLHNRHFLFETAQKFTSNAYRHHEPLSVLVVDLDHFKVINDSHGHAQGDAVLKAVAGLMRSNVRAGDVIARFGGEEFVLVFPRCPLPDACAKAEVLRQKLDALHPVGISVSASFGVATLPVDEKITFDELFKMADRALYAAKEQGRNRVVSYHSLPVSAAAAMG